MARAGIPDDVRSLIADHIDSVLELEILLAIRGQQNRCLPAELARELRLNDTATAAALNKFAVAGLVNRDGDGFALARPAGAVDALAEAYSSRRVRVIELIYSGPSGSVSAFADAFKLRKED